MYPQLSRWTKVVATKAGPQLFSGPDGELAGIYAHEALILSLFNGQNSLESIVAAVDDISGRGKAVVQNALENFSGHFVLTENPVSATTTTKGNLSSCLVARPELTKEKSPLFLTFLLTDACNLKCDYCFRSPILVDGRLKPTEIHRLIDEAADFGALKITFVGGEPLLDKEFPSYVTKCISAGILPFFSTNGVLLTDALVDQLAAAGAPIVQISLDAMSDEVAYDVAKFKNVQRVKDAIEYSANSGLSVLLKTVVTKKNLPEVHDIISFGEQVGVWRHSVAPAMLSAGMDPSGNSVQYLDQSEVSLLKEHISKRRESGSPVFLDIQAKKVSPSPMNACGGFVLSLAVQPNGDVGFCGNLPDLRYGNVRDGGIMRAWRGDDFARLHEETYGALSEECSSCEFLSACKSGCAWQKRSQGLDFDSTDPRCFKYKGVTKALYNRIPLENVE